MSSRLLCHFQPNSHHCEPSSEKHKKKFFISYPKIFDGYPRKRPLVQKPQKWRLHGIIFLCIFAPIDNLLTNNYSSKNQNNYEENDLHLGLPHDGSLECKRTNQ